MLQYAAGGVEGRRRVTSQTGLTSDWTIHWGWPSPGEEGARGWWWMSTCPCWWDDSWLRREIIWNPDGRDRFQQKVKMRWLTRPGTVCDWRWCSFRLSRFPWNIVVKRERVRFFPPTPVQHVISAITKQMKKSVLKRTWLRKRQSTEAKMKQGTRSHLMEQDKPKQISPCGTQSDLLHLGSSLKSAFSPSMALTTSVINTETWRSVTAPEFKGGGQWKKIFSTAVDWGSLVSAILTITAGKDKRWRPNWATCINV